MSQQKFHLSRSAGVVVLAFLLIASPRPVRAQVNYEVHFKLEKETYWLGEPVFCDFTIRNTGAQPFFFSYRFPSRAANPELESEPRFTVTDARNRPLPDPAAHPCDGAKGSVVYGTATLPPGATHVERWLVNEWARFAAPGDYHLRAERRLPLYVFHPPAESLGRHPAAYAFALDEFSIRIETPTATALRDAFQSYLAALGGKPGPRQEEAMLVTATLPHPFLFPELSAFAESPAENPVLKREAVRGLARLDTPAAWRAILRVAEGDSRQHRHAASPISLRAFAVLLLGEKGNRAFIPPLLRMLKTAPPELRGDILQTLGFFRDPRSSRALIENLHSPNPLNRVNAILGLKNLDSKNVIPAILAMLSDPDARVRAVANFALETLTGQQFRPPASPQDAREVARRWHAWWRTNNANFEPERPAPCRDW